MKYILAFVFVLFLYWLLVNETDELLTRIASLEYTILFGIICFIISTYK